jgi:hypothetical protein
MCIVTLQRMRQLLITVRCSSNQQNDDRTISGYIQLPKYINFICGYILINLYYFQFILWLVLFIFLSRSHAFLEKSTIAEQIIKFPTFYVTSNSFPFHNNDLYPEPDESSPYRAVIFV